MKKLLLLICMVCGMAQGYAQEEETITPYLFNEFQEVTVFFKNGAQFTVKMNYNILMNKFYFIDPERKVLELDNPQDITVIHFGSRVFYPEATGEGIEVLPTTPTLYVQYKGHIRKEAPTGAYGMQSETAAINMYSTSVAGNWERFELDPEKLFVGRRYNIYWVEKNGKKKPFKNFKQFVKLYPKHKEVLEAFIRENKTDFDNVEHIRALLTHAESLQ